MHRTCLSLVILPQRRPSSTSYPLNFPPVTYESLKDRCTDTVSRPTLPLSPTAGSTVPGPGAITGRMLKRLGKKVERGAEYVVIRAKLSQIAKMQPDFLRSDRNLTIDEHLEITDQCEKLVELSIVGMGYPLTLMTRAFSLILSGCEQPGRQIWSYHIAEAISRCELIDVFEIFQEGFFTLLDDSIFRIDGFVDLETLAFRGPAVSHEIAVIISHLARKDIAAGSLPVPPGPSTASLDHISRTVVGIGPSFSSIIIKAGFLRLVAHWAARGLPHWDLRGRERLEVALKDVAEAQLFHGDPGGKVEEANELIRKLQGRRFIFYEATAHGNRPEA